MTAAETNFIANAGSADWEVVIQSVYNVIWACTHGSPAQDGAIGDGAALLLQKLPFIGKFQKKG
jgi:hypothetical protein